MIKILLIVLASIVGFIVLFFVGISLASRKMSRAAMAFLRALQEERYRHAHDMLDTNTMKGLTLPEFTGLLKEEGIYDIVQVKRYPGDFAIGVNAGSLTPLLAREDGEVIQVTLHLRKTDGRWNISAIETSDRLIGTPLVEQTQEREDAKEFYRQQRQHVEKVFNEHAARAGCPCSWREFVYFAGKQHGQGRQDELQNDLVRVALRSGIFDQRAHDEDYSGLVCSCRCRQCGSTWQQFAVEWRMNAIALRLVRTDDQAPDVSGYKGFESDRIFQTEGIEAPPGVRTLNLWEWSAFMGADHLLSSVPD